MAAQHKAPQRRRLRPNCHAVYELTAELLLVFKPQGHREGEHMHEYTQTLRVLAGALEVVVKGKPKRLTAQAAPLVIEAGAVHSTRALADTWVAVQRAQARLA
ncbi:MAG: cupin domain-containing protein [Candidatus Binatia bacterium]|nr:cupin domain-containing protein [Candidatus Binatia bacterium]